MKKFIKITNRCYVTTSRGKIRTPILTPFKEDVSIIYIMIVRDGAEVYEVCPNGRTVRLTVDNFDKDNSGTTTAPKTTVTNTTNVTPKTTAFTTAEKQVTVNTDIPVEETPVTEPTVDTTETPDDTVAQPTTNTNKKEKYSKRK